MLKAIEIAAFFLSLDTAKTIFTKNLVVKNGRKFYDGNAKLNKFLQLAQNIYIAKTGQLLFADTLFAYDNGAVVPAVQEHYSMLLSTYKKINTEVISENTKTYLTKFFKAFKNAELDELIELSHEDSAWTDKAYNFSKQEQKMDPASKAEEYKIQYADMVKILDRMAS